MVYSLLFTVYSLRLNKNNNNPWQRHKSFDFGSGSRAMVFICKHLRPSPLNPEPSFVRLCLCQAKTIKTVLLCSGGRGCGGARKSPPPAPPGGEGSWNDSVEDCFWCFCFLKVVTSVGCVLLLAGSWWKLAYYQIHDGSRTKHAVLNFQKGFLLFLSKSKL